MMEPTNPSSTVLYPENRELSWRDCYRIQCTLGKADNDNISRAQRICYDDMKQRKVESILKRHEGKVAALFREGARKLNASHLASTVVDTAALPSTPEPRSDTSQCQPGAASLEDRIKSQLGASDWFSKVYSKRAPLSICCNSPYRPGSLSLAFSKQLPSLQPTSRFTPTLQEKPPHTSSAAVLFADLLYPRFPPSSLQHTPLNDLLNPQPLSIGSLPASDGLQTPPYD